jgi:hypothetical protein
MGQRGEDVATNAEIGGAEMGPLLGTGKAECYALEVIRVMWRYRSGRAIGRKEQKNRNVNGTRFEIPKNIVRKLSALGAELAQVVVQMLVGAATPLGWSEFAEEGMGMAGALDFATFEELLHLATKLFLFLEKIAEIGADQFFGGGAVFGEGLFVGIDGFKDGSEDAADESARNAEPAGGHIHAGRTVGEHLGDVHFAPLRGGGGVQSVDAG